MKNILFILMLVFLSACQQFIEHKGTNTEQSDALYLISTGLKSRSISFENISGEVGKGGMAKSPLGVGRKGSPVRLLAPDKEVQLANITGPGTIRHIWMTTFNKPEILRGTVIRVYWEGQEHPSIESPLGDFFGFAHGKTSAFQNAVHSVGKEAGMNIWIPMPFVQRARITITNELSQPIPLFFQIDYTLGDVHAKNVGRLHVLFRRENPTTLSKDFELLPHRSGQGRYLGAVIGVRPKHSEWWGEGEVKMFLDTDKEFPTIVGTGSEDYVGLSWGLQNTAFLYHGVNYKESESAIETGRVSMYRWHIKDPVYWSSDVRVTVQQIGQHNGNRLSIEDYQANLFERQDDWSTATFWYQAIPSKPLPTMPDRKARLANLGVDN